MRYILSNLMLIFAGVFALPEQSLALEDPQSILSICETAPADDTLCELTAKTVSLGILTTRSMANDTAMIIDASVKLFQKVLETFPESARNNANIVNIAQRAGQIGEFDNDNAVHMRFVDDLIHSLNIYRLAFERTPPKGIENFGGALKTSIDTYTETQSQYLRTLSSVIDRAENLMTTYRRHPELFLWVIEKKRFLEQRQAALAELEQKLALENSSEQIAEGRKAIEDGNSDQGEAALQEACLIGGTCLLTFDRLNEIGNREQLLNLLDQLDRICATETRNAQGCVDLALILLGNDYGLPTDAAKAKTLLSQSCAQGALRGCHYGAATLMENAPTEIDLKTARAWYQKACTEIETHPWRQSCGALGEMMLSGAGGAVDELGGMQYLSLGCDPEDRKATTGCAALGEALRTGRVLPADPQSAYEVFSHGCNNGPKTAKSGQACWDASMMHRRAEIAPRTWEAVRPWLEKGCEHRHAASCGEVAGLMGDGLGGPKQPEKAFEAALFACRQDDVDGCRLTGHLAHYGIGTPVNPSLARDAYRRACDKDNDFACTGLVASLMEGFVSAEEGRELFTIVKRLCDADSSSACNNLGVAYSKGYGTPRNSSAARQALEKACRLGEQKACENLKRLRR